MPRKVRAVKSDTVFDTDYDYDVVDGGSFQFGIG
jgi:hypothetical protein